MESLRISSTRDNQRSLTESSRCRTMVFLVTYDGICVKIYNIDYRSNEKCLPIFGEVKLSRDVCTVDWSHGVGLPIVI